MVTLPKTPISFLKVEQNIQRLMYLLSLFRMTEVELLSLINEGLKKPLTKSDIFISPIDIRLLKRIDKIFNKGLHYYLDSKFPQSSKDASIFFRKSNFGTELNISARKIVNQFEDFKISLSAIAKLAELNLERNLPVFNIKQNPKDVATQLRLILYPEFTRDQREFLKSLIGKFAENNILVFEFVETWNKKEKANLDGFFLNPNVIVLKRHQTAFKREIFTLIHELGHFLLNKEEIEQLEVLNLADYKLTAIERWCNDFAYYFLVGDYDKIMSNIEQANSNNDYQFETIKQITTNTHLSQIALYTRLLYQKKITQRDYNSIKADLDERHRRKIEEEKKLRELEKQQGKIIGGAAPKPINSPLLISTIQAAFYGGVINEFDVCKALNISPKKLDKYIQ